MARRTKAEIAAARLAEQQLEQEALQKTINQVPPTPDPVNWSPDVVGKCTPYHTARAMLDYIDEATARNEIPLARLVSNNLYEIHGGHLGVYSYNTIIKIIRAGVFNGMETREHPYGRERSAEYLIKWRLANPTATFEQFCQQIEPFSQTTSTTAEENQALVRFQNAGEYGVCPDWKETYNQAEIAWAYIHFPKGKNRTIGWLKRAAVELNIVQDETVEENKNGDW